MSKDRGKVIPLPCPWVIVSFDAGERNRAPIIALQPHLVAYSGHDRKPVLCTDPTLPLDS